MFSLRPLHPEGAAIVEAFKADTGPLHERFSHIWKEWACDYPTAVNATIRSAHIAACKRQAAILDKPSDEAMFTELRWGLGQPAGGLCPKEIVGGSSL